MPKPLARYSTIDVRLFAPNLGAEIAGVAIEDGVSPEQFSEIRSAFLDHQVLFFKDQKEISPERQIEFGRLFGELHTHPAAPSMTGYPEIFEIHVHKDSAVANGEFWHSDVSCDERPPLGTMLQLHVLPAAGGDTMFSDMYGAYESLSGAMQEFLAGLTATHASDHVYPGRYSDRGQHDSNIDCPSSVHPVIRTHPDTQRPALYVNRTFTTRINELSENESGVVLQMLFDHAEKIDFQIRYRWGHNDMAFWDNRCCMHRAIWDYWPAERKGRRVTIRGERPALADFRP
ncbi:MAG: taurine dioxygenase [Gammaproteobacteria bacterium]|nr:taurine dioxygenase [Gammaproteobacteria bacterium]